MPYISELEIGSRIEVVEAGKKDLYTVHALKAHGQATPDRAISYCPSRKDWLVTDLFAKRVSPTESKEIIAGFFELAQIEVS